MMIMIWTDHGVVIHLRHHRYDQVIQPRRVNLHYHRLRLLQVVLMLQEEHLWGQHQLLFKQGGGNTYRTTSYKSIKNISICATPMNIGTILLSHSNLLIDGVTKISIITISIVAIISQQRQKMIVAMLGGYVFVKILRETNKIRGCSCVCFLSMALCFSFSIYSNSRYLG